MLLCGVSSWSQLCQLRPFGIRVMLLVYGNAALSYDCLLEIAKNELGM